MIFFLLSHRYVMKNMKFNQNTNKNEKSNNESDNARKIN